MSCTSPNQNPYGCGTVFQLTPPAGGKGAWTETVLHAFGSVATNDGAEPYSVPVFDANGNMFLTTYSGGKDFVGNRNCFTNTQEYGCGTVVELSPAGTSWTESVIHYFDINDGRGPTGNLVFTSSGQLVGTTTNGGITNAACKSNGYGGCGVVFGLQQSGKTWTDLTVYEFTGATTDGSYPSAGLVFSGSSVLGTTTYGGTGSCPINGISADGNLTCGTIFQVQ